MKAQTTNFSVAANEDASDEYVQPCNVTDFTDKQNFVLAIKGMIYRLAESWLNVATQAFFLVGILTVAPLMITLLPNAVLDMNLGEKNLQNLNNRRRTVREWFEGLTVPPMDPKVLQPSQLSLVTRLAPGLYSNYLNLLRENLGTRDHLEDVLCGDNKSTFTTKHMDLHLANFLLHLSTVVYEKKAVLDKVMGDLREYIFYDLEYLRFGHEGCVVTCVSSVQHNFVVLVFKGTSPSDVVEWAVDTGFQKRFPQKGLLPGGVHRGFFDGVVDYPNNKSYQQYLTKRFAEQDKLDASGNLPKGTLRQGNNLFWDDINRYVKEAVLPKFTNKARKPQLFITGHSLGAGTAQLFSSILLYKARESYRFTVDGDKSLRWADVFDMRGTITAGTPITGNYDYIEEMTAILEKKKYPMFRIIDNNDIVCMQFVGTDRREPQSFWNVHHLGTPYFMKYNVSSLQDQSDPYVERGWLDLPADQFRRWAKSFELFKLDTWYISVGDILTWGAFGAIMDHAPANYILNLNDRIQLEKNHREEFLDTVTYGDAVSQEAEVLQKMHELVTNLGGSATGSSTVPETVGGN